LELNETLELQNWKTVCVDQSGRKTVNSCRIKSLPTPSMKEDVAADQCLDGDGSNFKHLQLLYSNRWTRTDFMHCKGSQQYILLILKDHLPYLKISIKSLGTNLCCFSIQRNGQSDVYTMCAAAGSCQ
jgi:hypothetical protein